MRRWLVLAALVAGALPAVPAAAAPSPPRLAGDDRIGTAVAIARHAFADGADTVYLARADLFADAVAGGALTDGPILLVPTCGPLPAVVRREIARLDPDRVVVLGGPAAVCDPLLREAAAGRPTRRLAGATRVETAAAIAQHVAAVRSHAVYLARADLFADAVAGGALTDGPILLVPSCGPLPVVVRREIARLDPDHVTALGGPAAICEQLRRTAAEVRGCVTRDWEPRGPAVRGTAVAGAARTATGLHLVTRYRSPAVIVDLPGGTGPATLTELPTGTAGWAATTVDGDVYVGTSAPGDLYRYRAGGLRRLARIDGEDIIDLATAPDGVVVGGTSGTAHVFTYEPTSGRFTDLGPVWGRATTVRSVAATADLILAGLGPQARLLALPRQTGTTRVLAPEAFDGETFVYDLAVEGRTVVAGTWPSGRVIILDLDDPDRVRVVTPTAGPRAAVTAVAIVDGVVWAAARTGTLYRIDPGATAAVAVATPVPDEEIRALFADATTVTGVGGSGTVWRYDRITGTVTVRTLEELGVEPAPEPPQSLARDGRTVYAAGHWRLATHHPDGSVTTERVPGEAKVAYAHDGTLLAALYPDGQLWRLAPDVALLGTVGGRQIRPLALAVETRTTRVAVGTQADFGQLGGAVGLWADGRWRVWVEPLPWQAVRALTWHAGTLYLGGEIAGGAGSVPLSGEAAVAAVDPDRLTVLWDVVPLPGTTGILALGTIEDGLVGVDVLGRVFVLDPVDGSLRWRGQLGVPPTQALVAEGYVYAATPAGLRRLDPYTGVVTVVLPGDVRAVAVDGGGCGLVAAVGRDLWVGRQ